MSFNLSDNIMRFNLDRLISSIDRLNLVSGYVIITVPCK